MKLFTEMIGNGLGQLADHTESYSFSFTSSLEEVKIILNLILKKSPEFHCSGFFNFRS